MGKLILMGILRIALLQTFTFPGNTNKSGNNSKSCKKN